MSPRPGGETDKVGNRFELSWTVQHALYVLIGTTDWIVLEEDGELGAGVEFRICRDGGEEAHQVKRQHGTAESWTAKTLTNVGVLAAACSHTSQQREFRFISTIPARKVQELADKARTFANWQEYVRAIPKGLKATWDDVVAASGSQRNAWAMLRRSHFEAHSEEHLEELTEALAATALQGATPRQAVASLRQLLWNSLNHQLTATELDDRLGRYGVTRSSHLRGQAVLQRVETGLASWMDGVTAELLTPAIPRLEAQQVLELLEGGSRVAFIIGDAGAGKSAVVHQVAAGAVANDWAVSALRLDHLSEFATTKGLGEQLGLDMSPVSALAIAAAGKPSLLVVDQVDAVSTLSGRMPNSLSAVESLIREASAFPQLRIVLACRRFDADNDDRIRSLVHSQDSDPVLVEALDDAQIDHVVGGMGLDPALLEPKRRDLLRSPLNLVLLKESVENGAAPAFSNRTDLLQAYWKRKLQACKVRRSPPPRFPEAVAAVVQAMCDRRTLALDQTAVAAVGAQGFADDLDVLISEHVLVARSGELMFFHEAFFDYAFVITWLSRREPLIDYLADTGQQLFHRGQVRQVLTFLHEAEPERFAREATDLLLDGRVRFHIKAVAIAVLRALEHPSLEDWDVITQVVEAVPDLAERLWVATATAAWFDLLDGEGLIEELLRGGPPERARAKRYLVACASERTDRLAQIIAPYAGKDGDYPGWLGMLARFAGPQRSRGLFDQVLVQVRSDVYPGGAMALWQSAYSLPNVESGWALELLKAFLIERPNAWGLDDSGHLLVLQFTEHAAIEAVETVSEREPQAFAELFVDYLVKALSVTRRDGLTPVAATAFPTLHVMHSGLRHHRLEDALWASGLTAMRHLIATAPESTQPLLEKLAASEFATAQMLLFETLAASPEAQAEYAAALLLQGNHRLVGNTETSMVMVLVAASLLRAVSAYLDPSRHDQLTEAVMSLRPPRESTGRSGWHEYQLLAALQEDRLAQAAKRRLGELCRKFGPPASPDMYASSFGAIASPIPQAAQNKMSDQQWLQALRRYDHDHTDWQRFTGGAGELSGDLRERTAAEPARFAQLALLMDTTLDARYHSAVLQGLAGAASQIPASLAFDVIRHAARVNDPLVDRYLAEPLKGRDGPVPKDIVTLLMERAKSSKDPAEPTSAPIEYEGQSVGENLWVTGINTSRGALHLALAVIADRDPDGQVAQRLAAELNVLAADPSLPVRTCTAVLITACLPHAVNECREAFATLTSADDVLLAASQVRRLTARLAHTEPRVAEDTVNRMLTSENEQVRRAGGDLAVYLGMELGLTELLNQTAYSDDAAVRTGVADACAGRLAYNDTPTAEQRILTRLVSDHDETVRAAAVAAVPSLRGRALRPFRQLLKALIASPAFASTATQLTLALLSATDRIDDIAAECIEQFISLRAVQERSDPWDHDAERMTELAVRALTQAPSSAARTRILDLIDALMQSTDAGHTLLDEAER